MEHEQTHVEEERPNVTEHAEEQQPEAKEGEAPEGGAVQLNVPTMTMPLSGASVRVVQGENGERAILIGPILLQVVLPLDRENARDVATKLTGGVEPASVDAMRRLGIRT